MASVLRKVVQDRVLKLSTDDTDAIQSIIDKVAAGGGGVVVFPRIGGPLTIFGPSVYRINAVKHMFEGKGYGIELKDNVHLVIERGAVLQALPNSSDHSAVIHGAELSNVSVTGFGTIRGDWDCHVIKPQHQHVNDGAIAEGSDQLTLNTPTANPYCNGTSVAISGAGENGKALHTRLSGSGAADGAWPAASSKVVLRAKAQAHVSGGTVTFLVGESGMGIRLFGVTDFTVRDVTVENCWGDGIFLGGTSAEPAGKEDRHQCRRFAIENVTARGNRRANLTIEQAQDFAVRGGRYYGAGGPVTIRDPKTNCPAGAKAAAQPVEDCGVIGARTGIHMEPGWKIDAGLVQKHPKNMNTWKWLWHVHDGEIAGAEVFDNAYDGIHVFGHSAYGIDIHDNLCYGNGGEMTTVHTTTRPETGSGIHIVQAGRGVKVHDNTCHDNDVGVRVQGVDTFYDQDGVDMYRVMAPSVCGNECRANGLQGILVENNVEYGRFCGNTCALNGKEGIRAVARGDKAAPSVARCLFADNMLYQNNQQPDVAGTPDAANMALAGNCRVNVIQGNLCHRGYGNPDPPAGAAIPTHGLLIGPSCFGNYVRSNDLRHGGALGNDIGGVPGDGRETDVGSNNADA